MKIHWTIQRNNLDDERDPVMAVDCVLTIQGRIEIDGEKAGQLFAWYLASNQLDTPRAFWELWDLTGDICSIYEDIKSPQRTGFREPLPKLLADAPGLIVVDFIALRPAFRRRGLGMEVLREIPGRPGHAPREVAETLARGPGFVLVARVPLAAGDQDPPDPSESFSEIGRVSVLQ
jgi:GNAT superfamily N-acetyltransferase